MIVPQRGGKDVLLDYNGTRAIYHVPSTYPIVNLPVKYLGDYLRNADLSDPTSERFAAFTPTGKTEIVTGQTYEIWSFFREVD